MSGVKPPHPCVSCPPSHTQNVSKKLRYLVVSELPDNYPYHASLSGDKFRIPFYEIRGKGPPPNDNPDFGTPGDVYIDLTNSGSYTLYSKTTTHWVQWHAAVASSTKHKPPISDLSAHPHFEGHDRFLWCDGRLLGWYSRATI